MGLSYSECPSEIIMRVKRMVQDGYPELAEADVTMHLLWAVNDKGAAIKHHGWPSKALIRINNLRDRVAGLSDVILLIDERGWQEWSEEQQTAILDHELFHLEVKHDKEGAIKFDDANRPKLRLKPHDWQMGGFNVIAERHGTASPEFEAMHEIARQWKQLDLPWLEDLQEAAR